MYTAPNEFRQVGEAATERTWRAALNLASVTPASSVAILIDRGEAPTDITFTFAASNHSMHTAIGVASVTPASSVTILIALKEATADNTLSVTISRRAVIVLQKLK